MATIKFTTNLPLSSDPTCPKPWVFDPKHFNSIPDEPGVYIVGVKIEVNDPAQKFDKKSNPVLQTNKIEKFCPLIVGETKNLRNRITAHWSGKGSSSLNGYKELFDLNLSPNKFYDDIQYFDENYIMSHNTTDNVHKLNVFKYIKGSLNNSLIWFPDPNFFDNYLSTPRARKRSNYPDGNFGHLTNICGKKCLYGDTNADAVLLKNLIDSVKNKISVRFFYVYANCDIDFSINNNRKNVEAYTKYKMNEILRISTYAGINGTGNSIWRNLLFGKPTGIDVDLTAIKDDLVNMTGKAFPLKGGRFII